MSMYEVYSNLRSCIEDVEKGGSLDAHIALYALSHHDEVPELSIEELARACNTSPATISRFCRRVNGSSFRSFKEQVDDFNAWLQRETTETRAHKQIDIPWYFDIVETSLLETKRLLTEDRLERAVDWLLDAQNVYVYGSSFSNLVARSLCEKLSRVNRLCFSFGSVKGQETSLCLLQPDDLTVFVSFSGKTSHIFNLYVEAKRRGCRVIWISSNMAFDNNGARELLLPVSAESLSEYSTALVEGMSLQSAVNALYISGANRLRAQR